MPRFHVPDLLITPRQRGYTRGQEGIEGVLRAALAILVEEGYPALSFRRVAALRHERGQRQLLLPDEGRPRP